MQCDKKDDLSHSAYMDTGCSPRPSIQKKNTSKCVWFSCCGKLSGFHRQPKLIVWFPSEFPHENFSQSWADQIFRLFFESFQFSVRSDLSNGNFPGGGYSRIVPGADQLDKIHKNANIGPSVFQMALLQHGIYVDIMQGWLGIQCINEYTDFFFVIHILIFTGSHYKEGILKRCLWTQSGFFSNQWVKGKENHELLWVRFPWQKFHPKKSGADGVSNTARWFGTACRTSLSAALRRRRRWPECFFRTPTLAGMVPRPEKLKRTARI